MISESYREKDSHDGEEFESEDSYLDRKVSHFLKIHYAKQTEAIKRKVDECFDVYSDKFEMLLQEFVERYIGNLREEIDKERIVRLAMENEFKRVWKERAIRAKEAEENKERISGFKAQIEEKLPHLERLVKMLNSSVQGLIYCQDIGFALQKQDEMDKNTMSLFGIKDWKPIQFD